MCGKCGSCVAKVGCLSIGLGLLSGILAAVSRLTHFSPMTLGPRSFAGASVLFFLLSIAIHTCKAACHDHSACETKGEGH